MVMYGPGSFCNLDRGEKKTMSSMVTAVFFRVNPYSLPIYSIWQDADDNRVAQWLNQTSDGSILQLSYSLNSEAREGTYQVIVTVGEMKIYHNFQVEKYGKLLLVLCFSTSLCRPLATRQKCVTT